MNFFSVFARTKECVENCDYTPDGGIVIIIYLGLVVAFLLYLINKDKL